MRKPIIAFALGLALVAAAVAQTPPRLLSNADIKDFVRDFKPMGDELDALGLVVDPGEPGPNGMFEMLDRLRANAEAQRILRKYGWDGPRFQKLAAILTAFAAVKIEKSRAEAASPGGDIQAMIAEIERNPQIPPEQKAAMKAQAAQATQDMAAMEKRFRERVHPADLDLVKANEAALDEVLDRE